MKFSAFLGVAGLSDVGFQFYDAAEAAIGARSTAGVIDAGQGYYTVNAVLPGGAQSIRWNSAGTVDAIAREYLDDRLQNLDASISSRLPTSSYSAPPTAAAIRQEIDTNSTKLDVAVSSRMASFVYTAPPSAASIRSEMDTNSTKLALIDATVSSRLPASSYSAPPTAAAIRQEIDTNSAKLDASISSRMASFVYTAPPSAASIRSEMDTNSTKLALIDATVSSRLPTSSYSAPPTAASIATQVNTTLTSVHGGGSWQTGEGGGSGSGIGAHAVTISVTDGTNPLQNAAVRLTEGINSFTSLTDVDGTASFSLDAATYTRTITKSGYSFTPDTVEIVGPADLPGIMAVIAPVAAPADPALCRVHGHLITSSGEPAPGIQLKFTLRGAQLLSAEQLIADKSLQVRSDSNGFFQLDLVRNDAIDPSGSTYEITCRELNQGKPFAIRLSATTYDLKAVVS